MSVDFDPAVVLGLVALLGLTLFYIPQVITIHRAKTLSGFSVPAWGCLLIACMAFSIQFWILGIWTAIAANIVGVFSVGYTLIQILRKQERGTTE